MRSALPKVLHPLAGRPLLDHAVRVAAALAPADLVVVVGHGREQVSAYLDAEHPSVRQAVQAEQLGTGHAVARALDGRPTPTGTVLVTYGDVPLLTTATLTELLAEHHRSGHGVTILTAQLPDPIGYGRIVRDGRGAVAAIVEQRDADPGQQRITEINSGIYAFDGPALAAALPRLTGDNAAGERYLTDVVALLVGAGRSVGTVAASDPVQTEGVNDRVQLTTLAHTLNGRLIRELQLSRGHRAGSGHHLGARGCDRRARHGAASAHVVGGRVPLSGRSAPSGRIPPWPAAGWPTGPPCSARTARVR